MLTSRRTSRPMKSSKIRGSMRFMWLAWMMCSWPSTSTQWPNVIPWSTYDWHFAVFLEHGRRNWLRKERVSDFPNIYEDDYLYHFKCIAIHFIADDKAAFIGSLGLLFDATPLLGGSRSKVPRRLPEHFAFDGLQFFFCSDSWSWRREIRSSVLRLKSHPPTWRLPEPKPFSLSCKH